MNQEPNDLDHERTAAAPGARLIRWLMCLGSVALSVLLISRWGTLSPVQHVMALVVVGFAALMVLPAIAILVLKLVLWLLFRRVAADLRRAGASIVAQNAGIYGKVHVFRPATAEDRAAVDLARYDAAAADLGACDFRPLGDVVDATLQELGHASPMIRVLGGPGGTTSAGLYHFPAAAGEVPGPITCDLETEFTDGTFLATSNTEGRDLTTAATGVERRLHPVGTALGTLVLAHQRAMQELLAGRPGVACVSMGSLDEVLAMQARLQAAKNAFRQRIGFVDPAEVARIARHAGGGAADMADQFAEATDEARRPHRGPTGGR